MSEKATKFESLTKDEVLQIIDVMVDGEREALIDDIPRLYCTICGTKLNENGECENHG